MNGLKQVTLKDVCELVQYGYTASASTEACGPRFLRITDIVPDALDWESVPYCEIDEGDRERFALRVGDIVVARTGATVGYAKLIRKPIDSVFASYLVRFRVDATIAEPGYIGRLVESQAYKTFIQSRVGGAAQPNASAPVLGSFQFTLPPVGDQRRYSDLLSTYDDLIDNNRRRIKLLEDSVRLLFDEWFVRLQFPGHAASTIIAGMPAGWSKVALDQVLLLQRGFDLPSQDREAGDVPIYGSTGIVGFHNKARVTGPGLVTGRSGSLGEVHFVAQDFWPLNTALWVKEFKRATPLYALHLLRGMRLEQYNGGVSVPTLDRKVVHKAEVLLPAASIMERFESVADDVYRQINMLAAMNEKLRTARDLLLPRLMNGELTV
ncbi:MAG: restriction endonuclease subunit S [Rubrivivax sp.]|nr:restriction endonuclease subunit S [Rubrivivax sp.]